MFPDALLPSTSNLYLLLEPYLVGVKYLLALLYLLLVYKAY